MHFLGIDIGSTTFKAVLISEKGKVRHSLYQRTKSTSGNEKLSCMGRCQECGSCNLGSIKKMIEDFLSSSGINKKNIISTAVTGSQIIEETTKIIDYDFHVSEVSAHIAGAAHYYPECEAILDVGGQDSKAMIYSHKMGLWTSKMSGICAAGTGAFLDGVAAKLNIPVENMADKVNYDSDLEFSSVCAVLSATSINKFKNRYPLGDIIAGACRAQARTIMSSVGEIFLNYKGDILFQGGVASNRAVAYYLKEITGNNIIIPEFHNVMGALGAACIAKENAGVTKLTISNAVSQHSKKLKSISLRASMTRKDFFSGGKEPLVWRNLFFPAEILNALGVRTLTLETYAALFARNQKKVKTFFDNAAYKGFSTETCSFLRILQGIELPKPAFAVSTNQPCQQGERIFYDLARTYGLEKKFYSLHTPINVDNRTVEHIASGLEEAVWHLEKNLGMKLDLGRLQEVCENSNQARETAKKCSELRMTSPPLIRGGDAVYFSFIFSQLWGKKEFVGLINQFHDELVQKRDEIDGKISINDTHRLLWLHLPPFYSTRLLDFIELTCEVPIVFEEVNFIGWEALDVKDPFRALAKKLLTVGFLDPQLRVKHIKDYSVYAKFNGCILYNHGFGRCSMADSCFVKHLKEELGKIHVPLLSLDGDCIDPTIDPCSTFTKVRAFSEAMNLKKFGNIMGKIKRSSIVINDMQADTEVMPFNPKVKVAEPKVSNLKK